MAVNMVIAGDYKNKGVGAGFKGAFIATSILHPTYLTKDNVESWELITDEHRKSAASGVARGLVGGVLLGPVGMLAGGLSAKNKSTYDIAIQFKDGKKSLIEVDKNIYKALMRTLF